MAAKKKRRVAIKLDMTPMVDIGFLLLIFYMATTTFKPPEARAVDLPESHSQIELPDKDIINITVTSLDSMYVDYTSIAEVEIEGKIVNTSVRHVSTCEDAPCVVEKILRARGKNYKALVVIKADRDASFGTMKKIMNEMQSNNLERFLIITDNEVETEAAAAAALAEEAAAAAAGK